GDRLGRAGLDAEVAVDAPPVVDLVDVAVPLPRRHRGVRGVVGAAHVDAAGRADARAQLAPDAPLHAVLVAVEGVPAVGAYGPRALAALVLRVGPRRGRLEELAERDAEPVEVGRQARPSSASRPRRRCETTDAAAIAAQPTPRAP